jgi:hypothetical protein
MQLLSMSLQALSAWLWRMLRCVMQCPLRRQTRL